MLAEFNSFKDRGIIFESNVESKSHLNKITSDVLKMLGFVIPSIKEFQNIEPIIGLYRSLILPILLQVYGSIKWFPFYNVDIKKLEFGGNLMDLTDHQ